jgi:hypothetical protein
VFFNRSVKISDLAALKGRESEHSSEAAKSLIFTDQFFTPLNYKIRVKPMMLENGHNDRCKKWSIRLVNSPQMIQTITQPKNNLRCKPKIGPFKT